MARSRKDSFQLSLFDTTALSPAFTARPTVKTPASATPVPSEISPLAHETEPFPARDFRLEGDRGLAKGWKARAADNLKAIALSQKLAEEGRNASPEEQAILARFTAFGAGEVADKIFRRLDSPLVPGWETLTEDLEQLVTQTELASLKRVTQYAHYTPERLVSALWKGVRHLGFAGGKVLEPGCGTGLFFALMPEKLRQKVSLTGIEMDPVTARITGQLFPNAWIRNEDFTKAKLPDSYDLAIGNPPFSDRTVHGDDATGKLNLSLHDYFIARSIDRLKPGSLAAFVTSRYTLDKTSTMARDAIAQSADLVAAFRLPRGAMAESAGTDVILDVLFFHKRLTGQEPNGITWKNLAEVLPVEDGEAALSINEYYLAHPEHVLGRHARVSSQYGPTYGCMPADGDLFDRFDALIDTLPQNLVQATEASQERPSSPKPRVVVGTAAEGATIKEGSYLLLDDELHQIIDGEPRKVAIRSATNKEGIFAKHARIIRALIPVRDAVRAVLRAQEADQPWGVAQSRLRAAYQAFVRQFKPINLTNVTETTDPKTGAIRETQRRPNLQPFLDDPDVWLVSSIENYSIETGEAKQGPIFTERVLHPPVEPMVQSAADALAVCLHERGTIDLPTIGELLGQSEDQVIEALRGQIYRIPSTVPGLDVWQSADAYLSGNVRRKLVEAKTHAETDFRYRANVQALEAVQPADLKPSDITVRLGASWIPVSDIVRFIRETMEIETTIHHIPELAIWTIDESPFQGQAAATSVWGTERAPAGELLSDALNARIPEIKDIITEDGRKTEVVNAVETEAAREKLAKIRDAFSAWVWTDTERAERLCRLYNDTFNNLVPRHFDGSHLRLPGASSVINFHFHQKRVIWRIISAGKTYIAHAVGAGKTFSMAAAIMEQKRLGLITKAMYAVPGHCLAQAAREFLLLYPTAQILVADETNFTKDKRQRFLARAATGHWDAIIITHSAFKLIAAPAAFEQRLIEDQINTYQSLLESVDKSERITRKRIEDRKECFEKQLKELQSTKDDLLTIGEIGVDQIIVDEAQEFRKLSFPTNMSSLKGVDPKGSQRAWDLYAKARYIETINAGRELIMASGTPITNTLGEMYTLQRYMQPEALAERRVSEFDAWAANFGETRTELELQPSGQYKPVTRFSEFVNVADLMAIYRTIADVVLKSDLRKHLKLPAIRGGRREIITSEASSAFKAYQNYLARRIKTIEDRHSKPQKGDDILLSVITDGRHAAIDLRFVGLKYGEPGNKLNKLIDNAFAIWLETKDWTYRQPDGTPWPLPGAAQMIFSDLGTPNAAAKRGFSAYTWIRDQLIARGVPASEIAFMQDYKKSSAKQRLFNDVNAGKVRFLIGSTQTMGTGVNAQQRLIALHHLDVPWLPSDIEQREGRIERQGNQNAEIRLFAYVAKGSVDATGWQLLERKARFIDMAMSGDRSIRRIEDVGSTVDQFAFAKALASGDERLMRKAGLEAEVARLERLANAHFDDQIAVRHEITRNEKTLERAKKQITALQNDLATRRATKGDLFEMQVRDRPYRERKDAGGALLKAMAEKIAAGSNGHWTLARIGGFNVSIGLRFYKIGDYRLDGALLREADDVEIDLTGDLTPLGVIARLEHALSSFDGELRSWQAKAAEAEHRLPGYRARLGETFAHQADLDDKHQDLAELEALLQLTPAEKAEEEDIGWSQYLCAA
ncbi:helicase-related protein [Beijerinckia indica]|uniref:Helicase domain protein n=1 Tax=Beijerinckia indica subsp. indica (strain ATCC 9039 / DSM 1715 / NCIMB 8712) TaxID=395963 RepID=B2IL83_BEII9|nr:helicase-related protein [Beijerinckia indica]ACB97283.1 helicase domain protein [Beijerinckia indica subsp. indica ATCC 9039]